MADSFEWKGYFSLPASKQEAIPGILKFDPVFGLELDLFGQLDLHTKHSSRENSLIIGFTEKGKEITLLNCFEKSRGMNLPGFPSSSFSALHLLVGKQFNNLDEICFDSCEIEYVDLNYWIDISGFTKPVYTNDYKNAIISYTRPDMISLELQTGWRLDFEFQYTGPMEYFPIMGRAALEQQTIVKLIPHNATVFEEYQHVYYHFSKFLALNYFEYPLVKGFTFFQKKQPVEPNESDHHKIEYIFGARGQDESKYKQHHDRSDFLFRYKDFGDKFAEYLKAWFVQKKDLEPSINMLTEALMKRGLPSEFYFIGMTQALENLHRKTIGGKNDGLTKRMEELLVKISPYLLKALVYNEPDFLDRIVKNRNHYTHHHSRDKTFVPASLSELFLLAEKLKIILITLLLQQIGMSQREATIQILAKSGWLYSHLLKVSEAKEGFPDLEAHF